jgi:hypothetical protein
MFKTLFLQIEETTVYSAQRYAEHNALTLRSIGPIVSEIWQNVWNIILAIEGTTVYSAQRYLLSTTRWHSGRLSNSFGDMTKDLKPYFCKLKKQQCIRRSATCWAQCVDTQVDWPSSFWDMTKCLKPYFCKLKKQQCIRRSATCWAQCLDTQVDWPSSFWDMTKCLKPYFC